MIKKKKERTKRALSRLRNARARLAQRVSFFSGKIAFLYATESTAAAVTAIDAHGFAIDDNPAP